MQQQAKIETTTTETITTGKTTTETLTADEIKRIKVIPLLAVLLSGAFVAILNETLLSVAITPIMNAFQVTANKAQWLTTAYMLTVSVLVPVSAFMIQRYTTRQLFIVAMGLFGIGTLVAGFAPIFALLLLGRIIQACGTGILIPLLMNVILVVIPPERRGRVMGVLGLVIMFAPAIGPTISGIIVDSLSWRWLFILVIPITVIAILYGIFGLKNVTELTYPKIDLLSILLSTFGFGGIVFGFSAAGEGPEGWSDPGVIWALVVGFIALFLFVWRQLKLKTPMLDLKALAYPMFSLALILMMIVMMTMFATMIVMPMFLLKVLSFSAITVGLVMLPGGIINGALSPLMGYLFDKFGPRWLLIPGIVMLTVTVFLFRSLEADTTPLTIIVLHSLLMISVAMVMMPAQTNGLNQLPPYLYPHGAAIANTLMQVAGGIGTALFVTIMTISQRNHLAGITRPTLSDETAALAIGVEHAFTFGAVLAVIALVLSLFIKRVRVSPGYEEG